MKVEIFNHDRTCVMLDLDFVPRVGELVCLKVTDDYTIEGKVREVNHWLDKREPSKNQVLVFLEPSK